ncbi:MAG: hypothetical protein CL785_00180 [Chloroflexi bacterium]|nr:hypothetical protein [Chloroflexota bacterium]|tara:strand:+ start:6488 stop:6844 length:357 start_codon:yes stop_codon:yes gene_type:complete
MTNTSMDDTEQHLTASAALANRLRSQTYETRPLSGLNSEKFGVMDWETWAYDVTKATSRLATNLDRLTWGGIGALIGTALAALPAFLVDFQTYPFVIAQPLGAAAGALAGIYLMSEEK